MEINALPTYDMSENPTNCCPRFKPEGWDKESLGKFWASMGGSVEKCMEKIKGNVDDPGAFCASL